MWPEEMILPDARGLFALHGLLSWHNHDDTWRHLHGTATGGGKQRLMHLTNIVFQVSQKSAQSQ